MRISKRFLMILMIFISLSAPFSSTFTEENLPEIIKRIQPSVVVILTYDKEGKISGQGSGFFINERGDVITNRHVLMGASSAKVKTANGEIYPITKVLAEDKVGDLIKVSVDIPASAVHTSSVSATIPEVGERIIVIGSPEGLEQTVSDGIVSAVRDIPAFGKIIQITAPTSPGSSGSPVVNMKGEIIGVATFQMVEGQNLNFAIPGERLLKLAQGKVQTLPEWEKGGEKERLDSAEGLYYEGIVLVWSEEYEEALSYFKQAVNKDTSYADAYFYVGYCNAKLGRYNEAVEAFEQAIRIKPDDAETHCNLGVAYYSLGRYNEAVEAYKQAIRIKPDYAVAHDYLGVAYAELGRHNEAVEAYKQAIRINPDFTEAHYNLGVAYAKLGRHNEAVEAYKQAIRINPDFASARYKLGVAYLMLENSGSALEEYKILKNLDKDLANKLFNLIYK